MRLQMIKLKLRGDIKDVSLLKASILQLEAKVTELDNPNRILIINIVRLEDNTHIQARSESNINYKCGHGHQEYAHKNQLKHDVIYENLNPIKRSKSAAFFSLSRAKI